MFIVLFKLKAYQTYNIENIAKSIIFGLDLFLKLSTFETYWKTLKALIVDQPCRNSVFVPEVPVVNLEKQRWNYIFCDWLLLQLWISLRVFLAQVLWCDLHLRRMTIIVSSKATEDTCIIDHWLWIVWAKYQPTESLHSVGRGRKQREPWRAGSSQLPKPDKNIFFLFFSLSPSFEEESGRLQTWKGPCRAGRDLNQAFFSMCCKWPWW